MVIGLTIHVFEHTWCRHHLTLRLKITRVSRLVLHKHTYLVTAVCRDQHAAWLYCKNTCSDHIANELNDMIAIILLAAVSCQQQVYVITPTTGATR